MELNEKQVFQLSDTLTDYISQKPDELYSQIMELDLKQAESLQAGLIALVSECIWSDDNIREDIKYFFELSFDEIFDIVTDNYIFLGGN